MSDTEAPQRLPDAPYAFRPAKRIQRIMAFDALRLLRSFAALDRYRYVGLGGWEFVDFRLVRQELGVRQMVSIEKDTDARDRYEFNRPFAEVELRFGRSDEVLADLHHDVLTIAWMDYTSKVNGVVLADLRLLCHELPVGSAVLVTVNARPDRPDSRRQALADRVGEDLVPAGVDEDGLDATGLPEVQRQILLQEAERAASMRPNSADVEQILNIRYRDGAPMQTWAFVLVDDSVQQQFAAAPFDALEQYRSGADPVDVTVPVLSLKEVIHLNENIEAGEPVGVPGVAIAESEAYARLQRWYPPLPSPL